MLRRICGETQRSRLLGHGDGVGTWISGSFSKVLTCQDAGTRASPKNNPLLTYSLVFSFVFFFFLALFSMLLEHSLKNMGVGDASCRVCWPYLMPRQGDFGEVL